MYILLGGTSTIDVIISFTFCNTVKLCLAKLDHYTHIFVLLVLFFQTGFFTHYVYKILIKNWQTSCTEKSTNNLVVMRIPCIGPILFLSILFLYFFRKAVIELFLRRST